MSVTTIPPTVGDLRAMLAGFPDDYEVSLTDTPGAVTIKKGGAKTIIQPTSNLVK